MAIYHLSHGFVSRSTGRSSVQSAAYITGESLHESRRNLNVSYKNRASDIAFSDTLAPDHAGEHFRNTKVWDHLENYEDEYALKRFPNCEASRDKYLNSAQTAQTIVVALPRELDVSISKELVEEFAKERFVSRNLIVTYAIHDDEGNPHAHLQISRRSVELDGSLSWAKDREIVSRFELLATRKLWADLTNQYLEREGFESRITEKSFADLGIHLEPSQHRGWVSDKLESMGVKSRIVLENEERFETNKETLKENPEVILNELTSKTATFTQMDLLKTIRSRVGDDARVVSQIFEQALTSSHAVGIGLDGMNRYTSSAYMESESKALSLLERHMTLNGVKTSSDPLELEQDKRDGIRRNILSDADFSSLSDEQRDGFLNLTQEKPLSVLLGRAGAGKTTSLKAVCRYYERLGYSVIGTSLSALAAKNLGDETGIASNTLHSLLYKWERYDQAEEKFLSYNSLMEEGAFKQLQWFKDLGTFKKDVLTDMSLILVDEAGMIGTRQWKDLLSYAEKHNAKIIVVGDDHQYKAIEAGDFFREIIAAAEKHGTLSHLRTIRRQKEEWMREASHQFAELNTKEALSLYEKKGFVQHTPHLEETIAHQYVERIKHDQRVQTEEETRVHINGLVLAFSNAQVKALNLKIRSKLRAENLLPKHDVLTIKDKTGDKTFAMNDRVVFLKNDKSIKIFDDTKGINLSKNDFIRNGTVGTLESVNHLGMAVIRLEQNKVALVDTEAYTHLDYGYALTTHKSQGQTVDFTYVAASKYMDAKGLYVAMTRHRNAATLFYNDKEFSSFKDLCSHLSKFEHKDLVKDYTIRPHHEAFWNRVQEYKLCVLDASHALKEKDFESYHCIKQDQLTLGKEILSNFEAHKLYLNQLGLTQEMLQITTGQKQRPLSTIEEKAKLTVELYGETASLARHLRLDPAQHDQFQELRLERDTLAKTILENYPLHREFVNLYSKEYSINKRVLENQVAYREKTESENHKVDPGAFRTKSLEARDLSLTSPSRSKVSFTFERTSAEIANDLNANIKDLAYHFLGKPNTQTAKEWRYGKKGSIAIQVSGIKQGLYTNFESGESGNAVKLIADHLGLEKKEAFKWGVSWLGHENKPSMIRQTQPHPQKETKVEPVWTPTYPIKEAFPDLKKDTNLNYMMKGRRAVAKYEYKDADSNTLGYVVRLEDRNGNKITPTLTYCRNEKGQHQWRFQGFGNDRPLYGLEQLKQKPNSPILIVEGEKTCEAARALFPNHAVLTWSGGCGSTHKSDWSVLKDKEITIWPDNDKAGFNAADKIKDILETTHQTSSKIVELDSTLPHKWDLADKVPEGIKVEQLKEKVTEEKTHTLFTLHAKDSKLAEDKIRDAKDLIHALYATYKEKGSSLNEDQAMDKAVRIGVYTNEIFKGTPNYDLSYKIAIGGYYAFKEEIDDKPLQRSINLYQNGELSAYLKQNDHNIAGHLGRMSPIIKQNLMKDKITKDQIADIAKQMGTALNKGFEEREILLINALYEKYQEMHPDMGKSEIMQKAVSVGIFMSDYHILFGEKEPFKGKALTHAYKFALTAYHCEKPRKEALKYAASVRREHNIDQHLQMVHKENEHYKQMTFDRHMENMHHHLKAQHFHQLHQEQMHQIQVHQQRQIEMTRGFER